MAPGGHWARGFPTVFWQTERYLGLFSTGIEKGGLSGFSGIDRSTLKGKGVCIGLICSHRLDLQIPIVFSHRNE